MNDFQFQNTTKVYFGKNQLSHLHKEVLKYGNKVLIAHGGNFIKNSSLYQNVIRQNENVMKHEVSFERYSFIRLAIEGLFLYEA